MVSACTILLPAETFSALISIDDLVIRLAQWFQAVMIAGGLAELCLPVFACTCAGMTLYGCCDLLFRPDTILEHVQVLCCPLVDRSGDNRHNAAGTQISTLNESQP